MNTAIKVSHLTKIYKLYDKPIDRLKESLHPLGKKYHKDFYALSDVSFEIKKGETVGIIGKNGAGKSTLLKIITGVLTPTHGSVHVNGRIASLLELGAGFNPEYTGIENIYFQGSLMGYKHEEMEAKVDDIVKFADIGDFVHQPVKMYSSGMFARLAFAVAINVDPDILIVDEALSVGDAAFQRKCFARMETIRNNGTTIVFVSHSEGQIVELCSRAIFIHSGQIVLDGNPKRVTSLYAKMMNSNHININMIKSEFLSFNENTHTIIPQIVDNTFQEFFDSNLISATKIEYPTQGAEIKSIEIINDQENSVNIVQSNHSYKFVVEGQFYTDVDKVFFGIHIRSKSGLEVSGQRYPEEGRYVQNIPKGTKFKIIFHFKMLANPDSYFIGGGLWCMEEENNCLHRVLDALLFKVIPEKKVFSFGQCNMMTEPPQLVLI